MEEEHIKFIITNQVYYQPSHLPCMDLLFESMPNEEIKKEYIPS
jgi:hypothetical protein